MGNAVFGWKGGAHDVMLGRNGRSEERRQLELRSCGHNLKWLTAESDTWKMSEPMERAVRHLQKNRNSGRLKSVVESELEEEGEKKNAWEK